MTDKQYTKCTVPECENEAEFDAPGDWCGVHWTMWGNWTENEPEPEWMTED
jgi:hypothetical protein